VSGPTKKTPDLVSVTTINRDGSRYFLHPSTSRGPFTFWRRLFGILLVAIYVALPWIEINGEPAVFLDIKERHFYVFGLDLPVQDLWILFFLIAGLGFTLFVVTALFGRLWCGWTCPYTVFIDTLYRPIEVWLEGDGPERRKLDDSPWNANKILRRGTKWLIYFLFSTAIAHVFLSYFVSLEDLWGMMHGSPLDNAKSFGVIAFLTIVLYFCFAWFREQFCIIMCPYGRLQSVLTDDDTIIIGYDEKRGEPRGKASDGTTGDCIDCRRCVNVCPTGIDIRDGLQLECIGCSNCIDACNEIMLKLGRPKGLVRYDSMNALAGKKRRFLRPRLFLYCALFLVGGTLLAVTASRNARSFTAQMTRTRGNPYLVNDQAILNRWKLTLINKRNQPATFTVALDGSPAGLRMVGVDGPIKFAPRTEKELSVVFAWDRATYTGRSNFEIVIRSEKAKGEIREEVSFVGPNPQLLDDQ
jgi:cytochrome c oxidase accessory protein FixG